MAGFRRIDPTKIAAGMAEEVLARQRQRFHNQALTGFEEGSAVAKILIVDDDSAVQATIRLILERAGHDVVAAGDGRKGLAVCEAGDFDLLFLDIFMPGMDGIETMRLVHQQRPLVPIIVISGNPVLSDSGKMPDFLTMATKLGAVSSLQKPFKPAALIEAVNQCLEAAKRSSASAVAPG